LSAYSDLMALARLCLRQASTARTLATADELLRLARVRGARGIPRRGRAVARECPGAFTRRTTATAAPTSSRAGGYGCHIGLRDDAAHWREHAERLRARAAQLTDDGGRSHPSVAPRSRPSSMWSPRRADVPATRSAASRASCGRRAGPGEARLSPSAISVVDAGGASVASRATFDTGVIRSRRGRTRCDRRRPGGRSDLLVDPSSAVDRRAGGGDHARRVLASRPRRRPRRALRS